MKPIRSLQPFAGWLLRICLLAFLVSWREKNLRVIDFSKVYDIVELSYMAACLLLLIGGFFRGSGLTMISAFLVLLGTGYFIWVQSGASAFEYLLHLWPLSISIYFLAKGNSY